eukprot:gene3424-650_t
MSSSSGDDDDDDESSAASSSGASGSGAPRPSPAEAQGLHRNMPTGWPDYHAEPTVGFRDGTAPGHPACAACNILPPRCPPPCAETGSSSGGSRGSSSAPSASDDESYEGDEDEEEEEDDLVPPAPRLLQPCCSPVPAGPGLRSEGSDGDLRDGSADDESLLDGAGSVAASLPPIEPPPIRIAEPPSVPEEGSAPASTHQYKVISHSRWNGIVQRNHYDATAKLAETAQRLNASFLPPQKTSELASKTQRASVHRLYDSDHARRQQALAQSQAALKERQLTKMHGQLSRAQQDSLSK